MPLSIRLNPCLFLYFSRRTPKTLGSQKSRQYSRRSKLKMVVANRIVLVEISLNTVVHNYNYQCFIFCYCTFQPPNAHQRCRCWTGPSPDTRHGSWNLELQTFGSIAEFLRCTPLEANNCPFHNYKSIVCERATKEGNVILLTFGNNLKKMCHGWINILLRDK